MICGGRPSWGSIEAALKGSRFFILLASPESARSVWVQREVAFWRAHRADDFGHIGGHHLARFEPLKAKCRSPTPGFPASFHVAASGAFSERT